MLYKLAHILRDNCSCVWNAIEYVNALLFTITHRRVLNQIPEVLKERDSQYTYRLVTANDVPDLASFFARQPNDAFTHFKPHGFDKKSLKRVVGNKAFLAFVAYKRDEIVGYFFLRCYLGGKAYRGKFVDVEHQRRGIASEMGIILSRVAKLLKLRVYGSISPENHASLVSAKKSNELKIIKTLENGDLYIEFIDKNDR